MEIDTSINETEISYSLNIKVRTKINFQKQK